MNKIREKTCSICQKLFLARKRKYCTDICTNIAKARNMSERRAGKVPYNKGVTWTEKQREKLSGPNHWNWIEDRELRMKRLKSQSIYLGLVRRVLSLSGKKKDQTTILELGYSPEQMRIHLESQFKEGMSWNNYGRGGWHVDHYRPVGQWPLGASPKIVNALWNLRPLWEKENLSRSKKWPLIPFSIQLPAGKLEIF